MAALQERLQNAGARMSDRLGTLSDSNDRWTDFYQKLNDFTGLLNQKEADLKQVSKSASSPEEQFNKAKVKIIDLV